MKTVTVTNDNYDELLKSQLPVIIYFYDDSEPCRFLDPIIEELARNYEGKVVVGKMDAVNNDCFENTDTLPVVSFYKDGLPVACLNGYIPTKELELCAKQLLGIDFTEK